MRRSLSVSPLYLQRELTSHLGRYVLDFVRAAKSDDPAHKQRVVYLSVSCSIICLFSMGSLSFARSPEAQTRSHDSYT